VSGGVQQAGKQKTSKTNESDAKMDAGDDSEDADDEKDGEANSRRGRNEIPNSSRCVGYYLH
jgi:hypothetical protein